MDVDVVCALFAGCVVFCCILALLLLTCANSPHIVLLHFATCQLCKPLDDSINQLDPHTDMHRVSAQA